MKSLIKIVFIVSLLSNVVFAQKGSWTLGFNTGTKGDVWQKGERETSDKYRSLYMIPFTLTLELNVAYGISDRISLQTGIAYVEKYPSIKRRDNFRFCNKLSQSAQIPVRLKYAYPIKQSNFYVVGSAGLIFDVIADDKSPFRDMVVTDYTELHDYIIFTDASMSVYGKKINFLAHAGIGFEYRFKNGLTLSLCGEYNIGTRIMGEITINNHIPTHYDYVIPADKIYLKGDYWNVGLGISYTFKQKKEVQYITK